MSPVEKVMRKNPLAEAIKEASQASLDMRQKELDLEKAKFDYHMKTQMAATVALSKQNSITNRVAMAKLELLLNQNKAQKPTTDL